MGKNRIEIKNPIKINTNIIEMLALIYLNNKT